MDIENKNIHTLFSTRYDAYPYSEYVEYCEINESEPGEEFSDAYWDWVSDCIQDDYDLFQEELSAGKYGDKFFAVYGVLDLWDGKHEIYPNPQISKGLISTIKKCYEGSSIDDVDVMFDETEGKIIVKAYHHDGTNVFEIKQCTTKWSNKKDEYILIRTYPMNYLDLFPKD